MPWLPVRHTHLLTTCMTRRSQPAEMDGSQVYRITAMPAGYRFFELRPLK